MGALRIERVWQMPSAYTFELQSVKQLLIEEMNSGIWVDPFSGKYSLATLTNDVDPESPATFHMDGLDFLKGCDGLSADGGLFDPPYSVQQALRCYKPKFNGTAGREEYHSRCKDELGRIIRPRGKAICFGWNSCGLGINRGFILERVLLICHGAAHYDTIVTVETKTVTVQDSLFSVEGFTDSNVSTVGRNEGSRATTRFQNRKAGKQPWRICKRFVALATPATG